jgi:methylmalonyl-CoA mutase
MPTQMDALRLAADFAPATHDDWRKLVDGVLRGASFEKLVSKTYDGLRIEPIYRRAHAATPIAGRAEAAPWQIMQRIDHPDAAVANAQALHDLENGANGLTLVFAGANGARGFGLEASAETIEQLLESVLIDAGIAIELNIGQQSRMAPIHLVEFIKQKDIDIRKCDIRFGLDPIGTWAVWGSSAFSWSEMTVTQTGVAKFLAAQGFKGPFAPADGRVIHDAGGSEAQELAFVLAVGVAYLRALEGAGVALDEAQSMVYARLCADADQFLTMAKFRALRLLWARIEQSCGLVPKPLFIAADTAWRTLTQRDPYVNILRATMAVFSAGLGGANSIAVLPHTLALGLPDGFARRVARNTQLVLLEESNLAKVSDPAAGSGGIEALTRELCETAWMQFQEIEKAGGAFAALVNNVIQPKVAATRAARQASIAGRREVLTGASEFPNLRETRATVLRAKPIEPVPYGKPKVTFAALEPIRLAAPFEALRDKSDHILAGTGTRPKIFLANLGAPADFTARATFAKSFFETGGIEAIDTKGFLPSLRSRWGGVAGGGTSSAEQPPTPTLRVEPPHQGVRVEAGDDFSDQLTALTAAFEASGATLACLCSSDKVYADRAAAAASALQAAGAKHIYLAGRPGELEAALRGAGVQAFIFAGGDALAILNAAYQPMG